jgi:hypothetical protein
MTRLRPRLLSWPVLVALVAVVALVELALPRLRDGDEPQNAADRRFAELCRERGGTAKLAPGSGDYVKDARSCEVRYGAHTYEMYAITPNGFDEREAARARTACTRQIASDKEQAGLPRRRVWHARTAICEEQP